MITRKVAPGARRRLHRRAEARGADAVLRAGAGRARRARRHSRRACSTSSPAMRRAIGGELCANPTVRKLTFTGSTEVGRMLMRQSADTIKKLSLELGGNAPFIVFDDADLDAAAEGAHRLEVPQRRPDVRVRQSHLRAGQASTTRSPRSSREKVKALKVGHGTERGRQHRAAHRRPGAREGRGARGRRGRARAPR